MKILDYFFFTRPVLFFPAWSTMLIISGVLNLNSSILLYVSTALLMGSAFVINQISDIETDKINAKCLFLEKKRISIRASVVYSLFLVTLSLLISYSVGLVNFYVFVVFFIVTGILYNLKPFKFKQYNILGAISNYLMGLLISITVFSDLSEVNIALVLILSLYNFIIYILTTLPDSDGDLKTHKRTVGNVLGFKKSIILSLFLSALNLYLSIQFDDISILILCLSLFGFIFYQYFLKKEIILTIIKWSLLSQAFLAIIYFPIYMVPIGLIFYGGRWYYKKEFNMEYPSLKNE